MSINNTFQLTIKDVVAIIGIATALAGNYFALRDSIRASQQQMEATFREQQLIRSNDQELNRLKVDAIMLQIERIETEIKDLRNFHNTMK